MATHSIKPVSPAADFVAIAFAGPLLALVGCTQGGAVDLDALCDDTTCASPADDEGVLDEGDDGASIGSDDDGSGAASDETGAPPVVPGLPCDVAEALRANCQQCHAEMPSFGAPMALVDYDDVQVPALSDPSRKVFELLRERLVDEVTPMPPGGMISAADRQTLLAWIDAGAPADPSAHCDAPDPDDEAPSGPDSLPCEPDVVMTAHASGTDAPFAVPAVGADNLYMCFAFKAPFTEATHATAWAPVIDDERVVHHWILYRTKVPQLEGGAVPCDVTLQLTTQFVAGWAPGGGNVVLPDDVGLDLGGPDDWYLLQVHYNNVAHHDDAIDNSGVAFCTSDEPRPNTAGILTLGSLAIAIPPLAQDWPVTGTCAPWTTALWPRMHVMGASPHMHQLGRSMRSVVNRFDGTTETLLDVPAFDFNSQGMYMVEPEIIIEPGESITTTCTYDNPGLLPVTFGERTEDEMCFDFVLAYPIDSLLDRNCGVVL